MKKRNIYVHQSQELLSLFEQAGAATKAMCVPIDYANPTLWESFPNSSVTKVFE